LREIPESWIWVPIKELGEIITGSTPPRKKPEFFGGDIPFYKPTDLDAGYEVIEAREYLSDLGADKSRLLPPLSVLVTCIGATIGKTGLARRICVTNQQINAIVPVENFVSANWLYRIITSPFVQNSIIENSSSTTLPILNKSRFSNLIIPLAPLNEQRRIEDKLDRILARVEACRERCDRIPLLLKRFRQSVLTAATSGQLTEDWREANNKNLRDWEETTVGELIDDIEAGINVRCDERPPLPHEQGLVKISAVTWGTFDDSESKTLPSDKIAPESTRIAVGDFLISRANTLELVGACVIVEQVTRPVYLSDKVLRLVMNDADKKWLLFWLRSEKGRSQIERLASGNQLSMRNLTQANLKSIVVRLPDKDERNELIRRVETLFAYADRLEAQYQKALTHLGRLTPALLDKAFRGELVPQDPNDEPASVLLERIRSEISKTQPRKTKRLIEFIPSLHSVVPVAMLTRKEIQPSHLSAILKERGSLTAESLWTASQLDIDDFYDQLKDEEAQGLLRETRGADPNAARLLEVA